jgi:hypothetical protein
MVYEYRRYVVVPGRLPDLKARFRERTIQIWKRLDIRPVGFWEAVIGTSNELHYILAWTNAAEREKKWGAFVEDAEWLSVRTETESHGPLVASVHNEMWAPTDFSALA